MKPVLTGRYGTRRIDYVAELLLMGPDDPEPEGAAEEPEGADPASALAPLSCSALKNKARRK